ncbi:AraC family transcriptional regulator [Paraburkholderia kururiensis]|uniref:AraC family transcriptional regulator n=1 Tax=Paraburkholderia kururiensis TaxID=984307 RepID=A0ABZ0WIZ0_9BURK|nr:AraC family transcriptional regulator [Paraburkholderia kururiensis]WQD77325.1 AraC family transcriptional regulator [Paraburkholderia kururiensis]
MSTTAEKAADWLLSGLALKSTLFHVGQYCGAFRASTAGYQRASFHLVLRGECWLHLQELGGREARSTRLVEGDAVFLLQDMSHCLSPHEAAPIAGDFHTRAGTMTPLAEAPRGPTETPGSVGLACGFFEFGSDLGDAIAGLLPDHIVARHDDPQLAGARVVFDLIRAEALRTQELPSPLLARLTDVLFFYALRAAACADPLVPGLWSAMRRAEFAPLVNAIIERPGEEWSTTSMAAFCHMSRARFCKHFAEVCGQPPAQFVALIRMKVAAALLRNGSTTSRAAECVGYQSESAFAQAFKRITGMQPGTWRREGADMTAAGRGARHAPLH